MTDSEVRKAAIAAAAVFVIQGWTWGPNDNKWRPSVDEIEARLWDLIGNASAMDGAGSSSTGRLFVDRNEDGDLTLSVELGTLVEFVKRDAA